MNSPHTHFFDIYDFELFEGVNQAALDSFLQNTPGRISSYKKGDWVVMQGDVCQSLLLLCKGTLAARMTNAEGKEITIEMLHAPELLAPAFLYGSNNHFPVSLQAENEVIVRALSRNHFLQMMEQDSRLLHNFLRVISDRSVFLSRKLNEFALQSLNTRIISYLKRNGCIGNVQEVAFILGVARPSLSRTLSAMADQGIIGKNEQGYVLLKE